MPYRLLLLAPALLLSLLLPHAATALPTLTGPGTLIAHFEATPGTVSTDGSGNVTSWTASNDGSIVLSAVGNSPSSIQLDLTADGGSPALVLTDGLGDDQVLTGTLGTGSISQATIFWRGHFGTTSDASGRYAYSLGVDGPSGSQFDFQSDSGRAELFGGDGTQIGDDISSLVGQYTVWRAEYGFPSALSNDGHAVYANGTNLNLPISEGSDYSVDLAENLQLFGFQNSSGTSGGFNFVGDMSHFLIYEGNLNATDVAAIETYLMAVPEPGTGVLLAIGLGFLARRPRRSLSKARGLTAMLAPIALSVVAVLSAPATARAVPITQPAGLNPGDEYRLIFVTSQVMNATSDDIAVYNSFVNSVANTVPELVSLSTTWYAVASTDTVDARSNAVLGGRPLYDTAGNLIITSGSNLAVWNNPILHPIAVDENGNATTSTFTFTGTGPGGVGNSCTLGVVCALSGRTDITTINWYSAFRPASFPDGPSYNDTLPFYAVSGVLTAVAVPEPGTGLLLGVGLVLLAGKRHTHQ